MSLARHARLLEASSPAPAARRTAEATRARVVREAIGSLHMRDEITIDEHWALGRLLNCASDATLASLGRMLK